MFGRVIRLPLNALIAIARRPKWLGITIVAQVLFASLVFSVTENRSFNDGLWWTAVTGYTVGYGELVPTTGLGRLCAVMLMSTMILVLVPILSAILVHDRDQFTHEEQEEMKTALREALERIEEVSTRLDAAVAQNTVIQADLQRLAEDLGVGRGGTIEQTLASIAAKLDGRND